MSERLITVLSVYYNAQNSMHTPYEAMMNQTYKNWEWVIVDNCSTDDTLNILKKWAQKDSRIKVIARNINEGYAFKALNETIPKCNASHIQFLGMDDFISSDTLEQNVKRIEETGADVIIPDLEINNSLISPDMENLKMSGISYDKNDTAFPANDRKVILSSDDAFKLSLNWRIHTFACFSKELLKKVKFIEEGMNADEFSTRNFLLNANKVAFSKGLYRYIRRPDSITHKISMRYFERFPIEEKLHELIREKHLDKKYENIINSSTLDIYIDYSIKYLIYKEDFSPQEKQQVENILKYGKRLLNKYCSPFEILKNNVKLYKYKTFYIVWKFLDEKLKKKRLI